MGLRVGEASSVHQRFLPLPSPSARRQRNPQRGGKGTFSWATSSRGEMSEDGGQEDSGRGTVVLAKVGDVLGHEDHWERGDFHQWS